MCELLGLNLLCLLSQNRVAEFHTELELFAHPDVHVLENVYIKHAVSLEQYLMEGRYNKVIKINAHLVKFFFHSAGAHLIWMYFFLKIFLAKRIVPSEAYNFFIDILLETIRDEIATCVEKSYGQLHIDHAAKVLNISGGQLNTYATKVG